MKPLIDEDAATAAACMTEEEWNALPDRSRAAIARLAEDKAALLAALRAMADNYVQTYGDDGGEFPEPVEAALAAIAKATEGERQ